METFHRILLVHRDAAHDTSGSRLAREISGSGGGRKVAVRTARSFLIQGDFDAAACEELAREVFLDPIVETASVNRWPELAFDSAVEIAYKPGVTDNVARTAREGAADRLGDRAGRLEEVFASRLFFFSGLDADQAGRWAREHLCNELIEICRVIPGAEWKSGKRFENKAASPKFSQGAAYQTIELGVSDEELVKLSTTRVLSLTLEEMKAVQAHFKDPAVEADRLKRGLPPAPTDVELEAIAQTWSEHCKHKIFAAEVDYREATWEPGRTIRIDGLFKTFIKKTTETLAKKRKDLLSVFVDNAGVVTFDKDFAYALKVETHNSPSALDPFGGAMTGIVGVNRDILGTGMGCRPQFNTDVFCFASPFEKKELPPRLLPPTRIYKGVHRGVKDGGNESGIPTVNGAIVFHERFIGKPLVFCGTGGLMPLRLPDGKPSWLKQMAPGQKIVMIGGRIGKDGIHGATFSSAALDELSPTSAVQIGDPITQKKMSDFLLEARDLGLFSGITDNGAGGLSSSLGEMATATGGCKILLHQAPLKYAGLEPWEILLSEAQERMSLAVPAEKIKDLFDLAARRAVEATEIGTFTDSGYFEAWYEDTLVCRLSLAFLHDGLPRLRLRAEWVPPVIPETPAAALKVKNHAAFLETMLRRPNIASKEKWVRQYDHEVQAQTVGKPFDGVKRDGPGDAAVLRPRFDSDKGLAIACGLAPRLSDLDARAMTLWGVDEALRNLVAVGADPDTVTGLDNFCWPDPVEGPGNLDGAQKMAQLVRSNQALAEACLAYEMPLISGKDSMKNDYGKGAERISVPPTLLVTAAATLPDVKKSVTSDFKKSGSLVYLVGVTRNELGGSEFLAQKGLLGRRWPDVDFKANRRLYRQMHKAIKAGRVLACHDLSDGGLAVAAAEMAIGGRMGLDLDLKKVVAEKSMADEAILYSESHGRFLVEVANKDKKAFELLLKGSSFSVVGKTKSGGTFNVSSAQGAKKLLSVKVEKLAKAFTTALDF